MSALLDVILPVFLVIGFGYAVVRANLLSEPAVDGLMRFAQNFAVPCLLFRSIAHLAPSPASSSAPSPISTSPPPMTPA